MTNEERENRNPAPENTAKTAPETMAFGPVKGRELTVSDLVRHRVYILAQRNAATLNYMGTITDPGTGEVAFHFLGPRADINVYLRERPGGCGCDAAGGNEGAGTLEDGRGVKVAIYEYLGPDA
jgi:hypothetical protein